jgi:hypothetical protein
LRKLGDLAVVDAASEKHNPNPIDSNICINGHDRNALVVQHFFSCVTKNLVKDMTNKANTHGEQPSKKRKIVKLSGNTRSL